jgi:hypothetical protein
MKESSHKRRDQSLEWSHGRETKNKQESLSGKNNLQEHMDGAEDLGL